MRFLIFGAGVLGSLYAARLKQAGHDVTILARGERLREIREQGIHLLDESTGQLSITPLPATDTLGPDDRYDAALILVRRDQVASTLPILAANRGIPALLFMSNNAAGADDLSAAVGRERVLLGFSGAGGAKEGHVVRCSLTGKGVQVTTIGELDGARTPRVEAIAKALTEAGFPVAIEPQIDAWLKTHVALVSPIAGAMYYAGDNYKLAQNPQGLRLLIEAIKEGLKVLRALHIPIIPWKLTLLGFLPTWLLLPIVRRVFATRWAELVLWRHASVAQVEMRLLAAEFGVLARRSGLATPAIDALQ